MQATDDTPGLGPTATATAFPSARVAVTALAGWLVPLVAVGPLAVQHEAAAGESAIFAALVWLAVLGPAGCGVAGFRNARTARPLGRRAEAFWTGAGAVSLAVIPLFVYDGITPFVSLGAVSLLGVVPMLLGYAVGAALGR
jgi:hypothetical protein